MQTKILSYNIAFAANKSRRQLFCTLHAHIDAKPE